MRAKDNNNKSGNGRKTCAYYEQLDNLLGDHPNVKPVAVSSSSNVNTKSKRQGEEQNDDNDDDNDDDDETTDDENASSQVVPNKNKETAPPKKRYKSAVTNSTNSLLGWLNDWKRENREIQEKRFDSMKEIAREKNDLLRQILNKLNDD